MALVELPAPGWRWTRPRPPFAFRFLRRVVIPAVAVLGIARGVEHLFDGLRLGPKPVESELRLGHVVEPLGLRGDEASFEQVQLLEELMIPGAKIREHALGPCERVAQ